MSGPWKIQIPFPPSVNHLYYHGSKGSFMTKEGKAWKRMFQLSMMAAYVPRKTSVWMEDSPRILTVRFIAPRDYWITKAGKPRRRDVNNLIKVTEDTIAEFMRFDDCEVWESHHYKVVGKTFAIEFNVE